MVISTGTKNLQEQIFFKDLPVLKQTLGVPFTAVYMKGRGNYLCLHRFEDLKNGPAIQPREYASAIDLIDGDDTPWETTPIERLVAKRQLRAWRHDGFWQPMDTLREKELLESMWESGDAPWKVWDDD